MTIMARTETEMVPSESSGFRPRSDFKWNGYRQNVSFFVNPDNNITMALVFIIFHIISSRHLIISRYKKEFTCGRVLET